MKTLKELLDKLYQAKTPIEKYELNRELIKAIASGSTHEDAKELVEAIVKLLHEHRYYKEVVVKLRDVFEEILS